MSVQTGLMRTFFFTYRGNGNASEVYFKIWQMKGGGFKFFELAP